MSIGRPIRLLAVRIRRLCPPDLAAILALTILVNVVAVTPGLRASAVRIPLGLFFLLVVPGYAVLAVVYPESGDAPAADRLRSAGGSSAMGTGGSTGVDVRDRPLVSNGESPAGGARGIDGIERIVLAAVCSVAIVPLIGLVLHASPWGISGGSYLLATSAFVVATTIVAIQRRRALPASARYSFPVTDWVETGRSHLVAAPTRMDALLNVAVVASLLVAAGAVGFAVATPAVGEQYSAVYVGTEDEDGEFLAANYPSTLEVGDAADVVVGVENAEQRPVEYTVVAVEQEIDRHDETTVSVTDQRELERFEPELDHGDSWTQTHAIEPTVDGEVRIVWLLFTDSVPAEDDLSISAADEYVHLWLDVEEPLE
ncbi:DUF1616 domain-containing protein [Natrarchaeobaculum aegyptiacum]|uniref:DUF1616 domain-containing protein n=1 Tax=Natrarchaeobaculum aegyptiacum TaxID=745377 RepID=A0A2Z2HRY4_9EURY|nr:DUF1616 domain-containing protein [Natrarchaeobaculum aegyptiacum]ARS89956.1 hypothetical protein B1756_09595 [Natrarchaeobaculum aegyptiacum]